MSQSTESATTPTNEFEVRRRKAMALQNTQPPLYRERYDKKDSLKDLMQAPEGQSAQTAGRLLTIRDMGKICFAHLFDGPGKMQLVMNQEVLGARYNDFVTTCDAGDFIGVMGEIFTTKKGEKSILVKDFTLLSKTLRPLPEKWHGLKDQEHLYRQRYLDLISNPSTYQRFAFRSQLIRTLREFYWAQGFVEMETPILTNAASGALATPFVTHHQALDIDVFLRIAPETFLKECVIGGFERVFELGRLFRNEGIDPSHLQDYTSVEHYVAYWNFQDNMRFTEQIFSHLLNSLLGTMVVDIKNREGEIMSVDFTPPWPQISFADLIQKHCAIDINGHLTADDLRNAIVAKDITIEDAATLGRGNLIDALYKKVVRPHLVQPTFITHHPIDVSPLARRNDTNPDIVDRFQLVVNGWELVNAYSELVDPIDQKERFEHQAKHKESGDSEAHGKDDDYIRALEHGAPPMSGWGMGIDRLVAILTQQDNLRDVVLFPLLRPHDAADGPTPHSE